MLDYIADKVTQFFFTSLISVMSRLGLLVLEPCSCFLQALVQFAVVAEHVPDAVFAEHTAFQPFGQQAGFVIG